MIDLTIGITTFNRTKFLKECLRSVLRQSNGNIKIIISNDNPDRKLTLKNLNLLHQKNIVIFNQKKNLGPVENKNFLLSKVKTKWFSWLSDDDKLEKNFYIKLSKLYNLTENKNELVAIYSNFHDNNKKKVLINSNNQLYNKREFIEKYTSGRIKLVGIYGLLRTKSLKKIKGVKKLSFPFSPYCDNLVPLELSRLGKIAYTHEKLCKFRIHKNSQSNSNASINIWLIAQSNYIKKVEKLLRKDDNSYRRKILLNILDYFTKNIVDIIKRDNKKIFSNLFKFYYYQIKNTHRDLSFYFLPFIIINNIKLIKRLIFK